MGYGHEAGEALALHKQVDAIGFTGSTRVGAGCGPVMSVLRFSTEAQAVALDEVAQISRTLREQIEARDAAGRVRPLARGVLSRSEQLAGAVLECIQYVDEWDDEQLAAVQDLSWGAAPASRR